MLVIEPIPQECWDIPMVEKSPDDPVHTLIITSDTVTHIKNTITNFSAGDTILYCSPPSLVNTWFRILMLLFILKSELLNH